jgi:hypothetical protein
VGRKEGVGGKIRLQAHNRTGKILTNGANIDRGNDAKADFGPRTRKMGTVVLFTLDKNQLRADNRPEIRTGSYLVCVPKFL